jgi:hypothetical protein
LRLERITAASKSSTQSIWSKIMQKIILLCASLFTMGLLFSVGPARAQNVLWVSATGNDAASCTQTVPCLTFQGAYSKGSVSQINCLSSGSYGPITITTSLTIDCGTGNVGNIVSPGNGSQAITINGSSTINIVLRHLSLDGLGTGGIGIAVGTGFTTGSLVVEDCVLQGFIGGISFFSTSGRSLLNVSNTRIINNVGNGMTLDPHGASTILTISFDHVELSGSGGGINIEADTGVAAGTIRNSLILGNSGDGIDTAASQVFLTVDTSTINANVGIGIHANSAGSNIDVFSSTIGANGTGVQATQGAIVSFGNNGLNGNGANGSFTSTIGLH